ncbi:cell division topological specificity factor MinE [Candidatus Erwinia haradaeae]|uniref:Cell division topological specificity factor n=1 Tax=Candidatus Erwinia haradaeae TaxID=1922217 RepID=A0A451D433_9GAMM|nr:cell division topological specificity factor MinE [Candidatus Erwinia haradaeae]VFP80458.1 Cell division topological specificity factor [Candidatus Erwinia haradaeae]
MAFLNYFISRKKNTASIAKQRLQIIVAERRKGESEPHYLPQLKIDLLKVIDKYFVINPNMLNVKLDQKYEDISILELNITFPETDTKKNL